MPIYEYECKTCEKVFEILWRKSGSVDEKIVDCPVCKLRATKIISSGGFTLSGIEFH